MKKKVGIIKRALCICLVFLLSINSFAAIVSDNDGSAFITKAEFDALKSSFQAQIDTYNQSIDSKIDGAISSYLAGINLTKKVENKFLITGLQDEIYMMDDRDPLAYKYNPTAGTFKLQCQRFLYFTYAAAAGVVSTGKWVSWKDGQNIQDNNRIHGTAEQVFTVDPTYNGHRTLISTENTDASDTIGQWEGYSETTQDTLNAVAVFRDSGIDAIMRNVQYEDPNGYRVYRYQAKISPWSQTGYLPDYASNTSGFYAQFNSAYNQTWRNHVENGHMNFMEVNDWNSNYGTIKHNIVCAYNPDLTGHFTVKNNYAWQRTKDAKDKDGNNVYGTTQAWIDLVRPTWTNTSQVALFNPGIAIDSAVQPTYYSYIMKNWDEVEGDLGGQCQFFLQDPGVTVNNSDKSDAWVPALGFHSGITYWKQVYQNAIKNVPMKQLDGSTTYKEKVMLTDGLPLFEIDKKVKKYEFTLEFDKNPLIDFTFDPQKYYNVNSAGAPNVSGMIYVHVNDNATPVKHVQGTNKIVKITIYPEEVGEGTVWMKWSENAAYSGKYVGGCTLKLQNHNTYTEFRED